MKQIPQLINVCIMTLILAFATAHVYAQETVQDILGLDVGKADRSYASLGIALNEFRSINLVVVERNNRPDGSFSEQFIDQRFPLTAQTYGGMATLGTYITNHFKTEFRAGAGFKSDTVERMLELNIKYWVAWYIGATHPITDYMSAYALYGVSQYAADVTRIEVTELVPNEFFGETPTQVIPNSQPSPNPLNKWMEEDLFGTNFSTSWMLGLDFKLSNDTFLAFEYGRLLKDDNTGIKVYQGSASLRFEF